MSKAVFLDRDGVINRAIIREGRPYAPTTLAEFEWLPGVAEALSALHKAGFLLVVVTNQPDVANGLTAKSMVEEMHHRLIKTFPIDEVRTCYHNDSARCDCRKPQPGALLEAAKKHHIDLANSYMVGDRWRDVEAGQRAGCKTFFIDYGYQEKQPECMDFRVSALTDAVSIILGEGM